MGTNNCEGQMVVDAEVSHDMYSDKHANITTEGK
jgi:hypothetical protein